MLHPESLAFTSNAYGYMLTYRGENIGGAGNARREPKHWRHARADVAMFHDDARREVAALRAGTGQRRMREVIEAIDAKHSAPATV